jgi:2-C-methyl-D-erythritol 4-phosphate cytidylyltransferase
MSIQGESLVSEHACGLVIATPSTFTGETEEYFWRLLDGRPIVGWALSALVRAPGIQKVLLAVAPQRASMARALAARITTKPVAVIGSAEPPLDLLATALRSLAASSAGLWFRQADQTTNRPAFYAGELDDLPQWLVLHAGNRPFLPTGQLAEALALARQSGEAVAMAVPMRDTVKTVSADGRVIQTPDRARLWSLQTPLVLPFAETVRALERMSTLSTPVPWVGLAAALGLPARICPGTHENIAITDQQTFALAEALCTHYCALRSQPSEEDSS